MTKAQLDIRICDCVEGATNTQTFREFILEAEELYGLPAEPSLDSLTEEQLNTHLDFCDELWLK